MSTPNHADSLKQGQLDFLIQQNERVYAMMAQTETEVAETSVGLISWSNRLAEMQSSFSELEDRLCREEISNENMKSDSLIQRVRSSVSSK
jgi:hypothetical protein